MDINIQLIENLSQGIVLSSHLHLLYAVIPLDVNITIDWNTFYNEVISKKKIN